MMSQIPQQNHQQHSQYLSDKYHIFTQIPTDFTALNQYSLLNNIKYSQNILDTDNLTYNHPDKTIQSLDTNEQQQQQQQSSSSSSYDSDDQNDQTSKLKYNSNQSCSSQSHINYPSNCNSTCELSTKNIYKTSLIQENQLQLCSSSTTDEKLYISKENQQEQNEQEEQKEFFKELDYNVLCFNPSSMNSEALFCDIPFTLNNFILEAEGNLPTQRLCSYNNFKKVIDVKIYRNGTMMDCTLANYSNCQFNQNCLINMLESKGNLTLYSLAQTIQTYYNKIEKLIPDAQYILQNYDEAFLQKRVEASQIVKERILSNKDPRQSFYFKTYTINWSNFGSPIVSGYGFSKGFCELVGLSIQENKQHVLRKGFAEFFLQNQKLRQMFMSYQKIPWCVKKDPCIINTFFQLITYDNIIVKNVPIVIETHNLSYEFDQENNLNTDFCEMMLVIQTNLTKQQESKLNSSRLTRQRRPLDDKDNDEIDLYYSLESQSFLERYYKDIYGENYCKKKQLRRCDYVDI